jgi:hypothetical protein
VRRSRAERHKTEPGREEEIGLRMDILAYPRTATVACVGQIDRPSAETTASEYAHALSSCELGRYRSTAFKPLDVSPAVSPLKEYGMQQAHRWG